MKNQNTSSLLIAIFMILAAAISRLVLYPNNFSPIIGMALFSGAVIKDKKLAFAMPLLAMFLSDLFFEFFKVDRGFYGWTQVCNYGIYALITWLGFYLKKVNVITVAAFSITSSVGFYFLSNTFSYFQDLSTYHNYARYLSGYYDCMYAGLPFLQKGLPTDLVFSAILFGGYVLMEKEVYKKAISK